jgi:hypothetical protein
MSLVVVALLLALAGSALAKCRIVLDCSRMPCLQNQECDSSLDAAAGPGPFTTDRTVPPGTTATQGPSVLPRVSPPAGSSQCRQSYICDRDGRCSWQSICY